MIELFESRNEHLYHVRYISQFNTPSVNTVYHGSKSISFLGPKILNLLPNERKNIGSLKILKNKSKNWKPENCPFRICKVCIENVSFIGKHISDNLYPKC